MKGFFQFMGVFLFIFILLNMCGDNKGGESDAEIYDIQRDAIGLSCKVKNVSGDFKTRLDAIIKVNFEDGTTERLTQYVYDLDAGDVQEILLTVSGGNLNKRIVSWEILNR